MRRGGGREKERVWVVHSVNGGRRRFQQRVFPLFFFTRRKRAAHPYKMVKSLSWLLVLLLVLLVSPCLGSVEWGYHGRNGQSPGIDWR